jgi:hypothetical protein
MYERAETTETFCDAENRDLASMVDYPPSRFPQPQCGVMRSDEPIASARPEPRRDQRKTVFRGRLAAAELHNTHCVRRPPLVRDCVFRDPQIPVSENPLDLKAGRLAGMMTPLGLQIASPEDSLARLGIITNGSVIANIVFRACIAGRRRPPVLIQGRTDLFVLHVQPSMLELARASKSS